MMIAEKHEYVKEELKMNERIKAEAHEVKVPLWKIATYIGVSEPTITRWMRFKLPQEKEQTIREAIALLSRGGDL